MSRQIKCFRGGVTAVLQRGLKSFDFKLDSQKRDSSSYKDYKIRSIAIKEALCSSLTLDFTKTHPFHSIHLCLKCIKSVENCTLIFFFFFSLATVVPPEHFDRGSQMGLAIAITEFQEFNYAAGTCNSQVLVSQVSISASEPRASLKYTVFPQFWTNKKVIWT